MPSTGNEEDLVLEVQQRSVGVDGAKLGLPQNVDFYGILGKYHGKICGKMMDSDG